MPVWHHHQMAITVRVTIQNHERARTTVENVLHVIISREFVTENTTIHPLMLPS
jgi:hypothetical protein